MTLLLERALGVGWDVRLVAICCLLHKKKAPQFAGPDLH